MQVKRSGYVFSLYVWNILRLWLVALALVAIVMAMLSNSYNYLLNYLFYRAEPTESMLTEFLDQDVLDIDEACAEIESNGGEAALSRSSTSMFFKDNVYQEGDRYRFSITIDADSLIDTGIYYDDEYNAYFGVTDASQLNDVIPRENYATEHLYFYEYAGRQLLLVMAYEKEDEMKGSLRVTFAPMGIYSLYMVKDLQEAGYSGTLYNYFIDGRETPVDFEDDDFKDLVIVLPFMFLALIPAILLTIFPVLHPIYQQLGKYARTPQKAAELVDANYEEFGILSREKQTLFLEDWVITKSPFKTGIQRNYKKQKY